MRVFKGPVNILFYDWGEGPKMSYFHTKPLEVQKTEGLNHA